MQILNLSDMLITFAIMGAGCCFSVANTHMGSPGHPHTEVLGEDWSSEGFPLSDMLITFAVVVGASCCISVANTYVRGRSHNTDEVLAEDWSSDEQNMDHLVIGFNLMNFNSSVLRFQVAQLTSWTTLTLTWRLSTNLRSG